MTSIEPISIFDIFKIGVGPSSSHTLGPWKAAREFVSQLEGKKVDKIQVHLFGSLSKTGKGHATDYAVQLGLEDHDPRTIPIDYIQKHIDKIKEEHLISINGVKINFNPTTDIVFEDLAHPRHPNTLRFDAFSNGNLVLTDLYASIGGGFIERDQFVESEISMVMLDYPIDKGSDILKYTDELGVSISELVFRNELKFHSEEYIISEVESILDVMFECVYNGCIKDGVLPGGLNVKRRAKNLCYKLTSKAEYHDRAEWIYAIKNSPHTFNEINKWISCFALAVNEENASLSRVVTSPTNGAAGVIPAVLLYYYFFCDYGGMEMIHKFLFTAGQIGCLFKHGATISAAVGGCQAEIGVSSAMAAAGLTEVLGGTPKQVLMAAEIAMEHHLGMTCDPIGGLVQIPCIERNAMGANKAITACNLALTGDPESAIVHIDTVIKTMWDTAQDMSGKYKETSEGGLAFNLPVVMANC